MGLYIGTAGWSYPSGKGKWDYVFYNNHYGAKAVVNAVQLKADLGLPVSGDWDEQILKEYPALEELVTR